MTTSPPRTAATPVAWVRTDTVRLAGLASVAAAGLWFDLVAVALMLLVLGGLMVPRALRTSGALDATYGVGLLVAAWSGVLDVYRRVAWWDLAVHAVVTGLVAVLAYGIVVRLGVALDHRDARRTRHRVGMAALVVALGLGLSVAWEVGEWLGHTYLDPAIYVTEIDTLGDLVAGGIGALTAGVALTTSAGRLSTRLTER